MRGDVQKRLSPEPLNYYYPLVQWATVGFIFILLCIIGLQSQIIDSTNSFAQAEILSRELVFIELVVIKVNPYLFMSKTVIYVV